MLEKTFVLIKPDGLKRKLIGKIISFYEDKNLYISELKMIKANQNIIEQHYIEHKDKPFFNEVVNYLLEDKLIAMVISGENAISLVRKINGSTNPLEADMGSIRGTFGSEKTRNLVHASDSINNAKREIALWFPEL